VRRIASVNVSDATPTLAERLGHPADARLVIISCDDLGLCHAADIGVYTAMREGAATCASLMVPAPWSRHAASMYEEGDDIGVHLTLNCEHENYRWGPITHAPSLLSGDGGFPRSIDDLWEHADPDEVRRECRAQIERALAWGIDVTHLAPHLTAITLRPEFFDVYLDMAVEFRLPIRLPSTITADQAGFPFRRLAAEEGVVFPDHFDHDWRAGSRERVKHTIKTLPPGVTEIHVQPAIDTPEVRAVSPASEGWIDDLALVVDDPSIPALLAEVGAVLIGYSELRDAQRAS
jgi:chitin disaccharide deacetylase